MTPAARPIESILATAVELPSEAERRAFVERACAGDPELKRRVEELIDNHFRAGSFLESPPLQTSHLAPDPAATPESVSMASERQTEPTLGDSGVPSGASVTWSGAGPPQVAGYAMLSKLGEGGMGAVWKAWHPTLARAVALKTLKDGEDPERFLTEARAMARLEHPNIVPVYEVGDSGG